MEFRSLFRNPQFIRALIIVGVLCAVVIANSIFIFGGEDFFQVSTSLVSPAAALVASFLFFRARVIVKDATFQHLWLFLGIGFGLWGIADVIWAYYALSSSDELPVTSIADLLWIVGYIPLYLALIIRLRTLKSRPTTVQKWIVALITLVWLAYTILVGIRPILADTDPERLLEGFVLLSYPIGDLGLVVLASITLLLLRGGRYGLSWRLIFTGIFVMTFSDMLYNYAVWRELYYPDNRVNFVTNLTDTSYILAYLLSGFGAYIYSFLWNIKEVPDVRLLLTPSAFFHAFVGTDRENKIISTSDNLPWLMNAKNASAFNKETLSDAFGIDPKALQHVIDRILHHGSIYLEPVTITTGDKKSREVLVSALATYDADDEFAGINFVIRSDGETPADLLTPKSRDLQAISKHVLSTANARQKEADQAQRTYFLEAFRLLLSVLYQFGGDQYKNDLLAELNKTARQKNAQVEISDRVITISEDYEGEKLSAILDELLQTARNLVSVAIGEQVVREKMDEFEQEMRRTRRQAKYNMNPA